jgi:hypothetical protein
MFGLAPFLPFVAFPQGARNGGDQPPHRILRM